MATVAPSHGDEEVEYESDPEDAPLPSMRRREASDDEDGEGSGEKGLRDGDVGSDGDSDGQGAAQVYDDEDDGEEEEYYDEEEEEEYVEAGRGLADAVVAEGDSVKEARRSIDSEGGQGGSAEDVVAEGEEKGEEEGEEKKEEPFAVPTSGAFYMHDDRFQENGRGRRRRMFGSRKLWDHKEEHAWLHDRFEEMNIRDPHHNEEKQRSKGRFRGRGGPSRGGGGRGYNGGRPRNYNEDGENQNRAPRVVRGRGPRRYEPRLKNYRENSVQRKQSPAKPFQEATTNSGAGNPSSLNASVQQDHALPQKHSFSSSLNYASPPFYPSGSSSQDILIQKQGVQGGIDSKNLPFPMQLQVTSQTANSSSYRAKAVIDTSGHDKFFFNESTQNAATKPFSGSSVQSSGFSLSSANAVVQPPSSRNQGRGLNTTSAPSTQSNTTLKQVGRVSAQVHSSVVHQRTVQPPTLPALRVSTQQLAQRPGSGNQASPPPQPPSGSSEVGESDSPPGSSKSKTSLVSKSKVNNQGAGRGSFLYGGAQVIGAAGGMGLAHGDQNFPGTPALLPVMQFGGQHPNGLGVPAMGMALPGYVAQPQLGFGNSEMTWVPVLAGAAGALGGSYCPPYIALDSSYYANQGQTQSSASSRETGTSKPDGSSKTTQRPETVNDELGQRQNKPRRYSEMSFGQ